MGLPRRLSIVAFIVAANAFMLGAILIARPGIDQTLGVAMLLVYMAAPVGSYWMLYDCWRYEKKFWPRVIPSLIPYMFVWHYFERVRRRSPAGWREIGRLRKSEPVARVPLDYKFESTFLATILPKWFGLGLILVSFEFLGGWLYPSWERLPYMLILLPFGLFLWAVAAVFIYGYCYIQILDGQLRFLRFFTWRSVPLESITKVELYPGLGMYVWANSDDKRHWLIFHPDNLQLRLQLRRSQPPVIQFLREVCDRNSARTGLPVNDSSAASAANHRA